MSDNNPNPDFPTLQDFSLQQEDNESFNLDGLNQQQLLDLHSKIETRIGGLALTEVNLVKETLLQVQKAKALQEAASSDRSTPMNQRAQVQNSLGSMLVQLGRIQMDLFNSERVKRIQTAVIKVVKTLPKQQQEDFFDMLEAELGEAAKETDAVEVTGAVR